jgi:SAM-dependent methyltransferase
MKIGDWEQRYRSGARPEDLSMDASPLVVETAARLTPGVALDIASGTGRNTIWLAEQGWAVTAVDGSPTAIRTLQRRACERGVTVDARVADLETDEFRIERGAYDLVCKCFYLQRSLFPAVREGLRDGGVAIVIVHTVRPGEDVTYTRAARGELRSYFDDWQVLHYREGQPDDPTHQRPVAEIVARKPVERAY